MLHIFKLIFTDFSLQGFGLQKPFVLNILSGSSLELPATSASAWKSSTHPKRLRVWTGFKALITSLPIQCDHPLYHYCHHLGPGNRLNTKLIQNSLAYGVSRTSYYFAKKVQLSWPLLFSNSCSYGLVFLLEPLQWNRDHAEHFLAHLD